MYSSAGEAEAGENKRQETSLWGQTPSTTLIKLSPAAPGGSEAHSGLSTGNKVLCF